MPISAISQLLLRLFAFQWVFQGVIQLAFSGFGFKQLSFLTIAPLIYIALGVIFWRWAPRLSRFFVKGTDETCSLDGVSSVDLYTAVIVGVGLFSALSNFGGSINSIHQYIMIRHSPGPPPFQIDIYETLIPIISTAGGLFLAITSRTWALKLARKD